MANQSLGTIRGTIKIDYDGKGIVDATKDSEKATSDFGKLDKAANIIIGSFGKFARVGAKVGAVCVGISGGLNVIAGVLATIGPLVGAGLATLPTVLVAGASAMQVAKLAMLGVGDALKKASGDAKAFDAATKGLAPNAKAFAESYRKSLPALKSVQQAIQNTFFKGLGPQLTATISRITSLRSGAVGVAGSLNKVVTELLKFARSNVFINALNGGLKNAKKFLDVLAPAIRPLLSAFAGLASQGGGLAGVIAGPLAGALATVARFVGSINLQEVWAKALPILRAVGSVFSTIGGIVGPIFSTLTAGGTNAAGILGKLAQTLATFLASAAGKKALDALGQAFEAISTGAGQVFLALLNALAPTIVALAPGIAALATSIAGVLVPAINALTPALIATATWITNNISWLGPLAAAIGAAAIAYKLWKATMVAVNAVQKVATALKLKDAAAWIALRAEVVATKAQEIAFTAYMRGQQLATWALSTAAMIANKVQIAAVAVAQRVQLLPSLLASTGAMLAQKAATIGTAIVMKAQMLGTLIATAAQWVALKVAMIANLVIMNAIKVATAAWTAVQWLLNAALDASPIGLVVIAVVALIAGIILLWKHSETFRTIVIAVWNAIKTAALAVVNWFIKYVVPAIKQVWSWIVDGAKLFWAGIVFYFNLVKTVVSTVISWVRNFIKTEVDGIIAIVHGVERVYTIIKDAFTNAYNAVKSKVSAVIDIVKGLPGKVLASLGNLGSTLYNSGVHFVEGFINGISSMIGKAEQKAKDLIHSVTKWLPGSPAEVGPLSGRGYVLLRGRRFVQDLAKGMGQMRQLPVRTMRNIVAPVAANAPVVASSSMSGSSKASSTPRVHGPYTFAIGTEALATFVIDTVTGEPKLVANTSNEGTRRNVWAGAGRGNES